MNDNPPTVAQGLEALTVRVGNVEGGLEEIKQKLDRLQSKPFNVGALLAGVTIAITIIGGGYTIVYKDITGQGKINETQTTILQAMERTVTENTARAVRSEEDRRALNEHSRVQDTRIAELQAKAEANKAALVEIESQFAFSDDARNMQHSEQDRFIGMLWEKVMGQKYFPSTYYPQISQHRRT